MQRRLLILGSTGSIGVQTLQVVDHLNDLAARGLSPLSFRVVGLAAGRNARLLDEQARRLRVGHVALVDGGEDNLTPGPRVFRGPRAAEELVHAVDCDLVLAAIVGVAGLPATLAAVQRGRDVALANKETLVAAGALVIPAAKRSGSRLLPVDSEHSALWQCLTANPQARDAPQADRSAFTPAPPFDLPTDVERLILTASGGALRSMPLERLHDATPEEALRHPTWSMGPKVTIDSASLMNKALELIEAHWLFGAPPHRLAAVLHPQSLVHALVEWRDGSLLAHLAAPDMKIPIQHALTWPLRLPGCTPRPDLASLHFEPIDPSRYPVLDLAYRTIERGGATGAVLNAANEAAVEAFLRQSPSKKIPFGRIADVVARALESVPAGQSVTLEEIMQADAAARRFVRERL